MSTDDRDRERARERARKRARKRNRERDCDPDPVPDREPALAADGSGAEAAGSTDRRRLLAIAGIGCCGAVAGGLAISILAPDSFLLALVLVIVVAGVVSYVLARGLLS